MRNRPAKSQEEILDIINRCKWCHVAMADPSGMPYVIPMNFGFQNDVIYIHGAQEGKKSEILRHNPNVCIHFSLDHELRYQSESVACSWSMKYRSVLCYGKVGFIQDPEEKTSAMNLIMARFTDQKFHYNPPSLREVNVMQIPVERYEGRIYGY